MAERFSWGSGRTSLYLGMLFFVLGGLAMDGLPLGQTLFAQYQERGTIICTAIGCIDQVRLVVRFPDGRWPGGEHGVEITLPNAVHHCRLAWPPAGISSSMIAVAPCTPDSSHNRATPEEQAIFVVVRQLIGGEPGTHGEGAGGAFHPASEQFQEEITIPGTPVWVRLRQLVDGRERGQHSFAPTYQKYFPNGMECGPVCKQSSLEWTLPSSSTGQP